MYGLTGAVENVVRTKALRDWVFSSDRQIVFRRPGVSDGARIFGLTLVSAPLELNSQYAYLMLCRDFSDTCVVAEHQGRIVGFAIGYRRPNEEDSLFVWQVAVEPCMRGRRLGRSMILALLNRRSSRGISHVEASVSPSNKASQALFRGLAHQLNAERLEDPLFRPEDFGGNEHEEETLFRIGPFGPRAVKHAMSELKLE